MRNIRFAHRQENHSRRQVFEKIQQFAFPITNKQVVLQISNLIVEKIWFVSNISYQQTLIPGFFNSLFFGVFQQLFAYEFKEDYGVDGWKVYNPEEEYKRQVTIP